MALYTANMLEKYYKAYIPPKKVVKNLDIYEIIQSFKYTLEVNDQLLDEAPLEPEHLYVKLLLKDETDSNMLDLGRQYFYM